MDTRTLETQNERMEDILKNLGQDTKNWSIQGKRNSGSNKVPHPATRKAKEQGHRANLGYKWQLNGKECTLDTDGILR